MDAHTAARSRAFLVGCSFSLFAACSDTTAPEPGSLEISVTTTGGDLDESYQVVVGSEERPLTSFSSVTLDGLASGTQMVELRNVADNCHVEGNNPRSVAVKAGGFTETSFIVNCGATGVSITTVTTGPDRPLLGYEVKTGNRSVRLPASGQASVTRMPPGRHTVSVSSIADECTVEGGTEREVDVSNRTVTEIVLTVNCARASNRIAFGLDSIVGFTFVHVIIVGSANGRGIPVQLLTGSEPSWSPDRKKLAYTNTTCDFYYGTGCTGGLVIRDLVTGIDAKPAYGLAAVEPAWSSDGERLAFVRNPQGRRLVIVDKAGVDTELKFEGLLHVAAPSWSPGGERLVFQCSRPSRNQQDICQAERDGTGLRFLADDAGSDYQPDWSPDGTRIVFTRSEPNIVGSSIMLMSADGANVTQLTKGHDPEWSPDGSKVILAREDGLYVIDVNGANLTKIISGKYRAPTWLP